MGYRRGIQIDVYPGEQGLWHLVSPEVPDLFVTGKSIQDCLNKVGESFGVLSQKKEDGLI